MMQIQDFQITGMVKKSERYDIYRAMGNSAKYQHPCTLLHLKNRKYGAPEPADINYLLSGYQDFHQIASPRCVGLLELRATTDGWILVSAEAKGQSLRSRMDEGQFTPLDFMKTVLQLARTLEEIHQHNVIHGDLNPQNIFVEDHQPGVSVCRFGLNPPFGFGEALFKKEVLQDLLPYISPERSGRIQRQMDARSDLYSMGTIFYEMLTGQPPFCGDDPMEIIHGHIARPVVAPEQIAADIHPAVAAVIMKLLQKDPEDRYQSSHGLSRDLEQLSRHWELGESSAGFLPARNDAPARLLISKKRYGREHVLNFLSAALERIQAGQGEVLLVCGPAGCGKTTLINEIQKALVNTNVWFALGKYERWHENIPYYGLLAAFKMLIGRVLSQSEEKIEYWKERILQAVGENGGLLTDMLPCLECLIGRQPEVMALGPIETKHRFHRLLQSLLDCFAGPDHPLVLFLDDLQWADPASLDFLRSLSVSIALHDLLMIGAYDDDDPEKRLPLERIAEALKQEGTTINTLQVGALEDTDIERLLQDTFHRTTESPKALIRLLGKKTKGNPFFIHQFLESIHQEPFLRFKGDERVWEWQLLEIEHRDDSNNVMTLLMERITAMPAATRHLLKMAACIGNGFETEILAVAAGRAIGDVVAHLEPALNQGLIAVAADEDVAMVSAHTNLADDVASAVYYRHYAFVHEHIRQAAYALIKEGETEAFHLQAGRAFLKTQTPSDHEERLFQIVHHLNLGRHHICDEAEKLEAARLNLRAGLKARAGASPQTAAGYFRSGIAYLSADAWATHHQTLFQLHLGLAACEYLNGSFAAAHQHYKLALRKASDSYEKALIQNELVQCYEYQADIPQAVAAGLKGLRLLNVEIPEDAAAIQAAMGEGLQRIESLAAENRFQHPETFPDLDNPSVAKALEISINLLPLVSMTGRQELFALLILRMVLLSLDSGFCAAASHALVMFGVMKSQMGDVAGGFGFSKMGLQLGERYKNRALQGKNEFVFANFVNHWIDPAASGLPYFDSAYAKCLPSGDFVFASYAVIMGRLCHPFYTGRALGDIIPLARSYLPFIKRNTDPMVQQLCLMYLHIICDLSDQRDFIFDEVSRERRWELILQGENLDVQVQCAVGEMLRLIIDHQIEQAAALSHRVMDAAPVVAGTFAFALLHLYTALARTGVRKTGSADDHKEILTELKASRMIVHTWKESCAANFDHMLWLLDAEDARLCGTPMRALQFYEQAAKAARRGGFRPHEAIAWERAAKLLREQNLLRAAGRYRDAAMGCYHEWGAVKKVRQLREEKEKENTLIL